MIKEFRHYFKNKDLPIIALDIIISILATYFAYSLRLESYHIPSLENTYVYLICISVFLIVFLYFNIYDSLIKYTNLDSIRRIIYASMLSSATLLLIFSFFKIGIPRSIGIIQPVIFVFLICLIRIVISTQNNIQKKNIPNLIIYGAGIAGSQLLNLIQKDESYRGVAFIDDDIKKIGKSISGIKIYSASEIDRIIKIKQINNIIIAIPSLSISERRKLINKLNKHNVDTKILPDIKDLMNNNVSISDIRNLNIDDLLERAIKNDDSSNELMKGKKVLITGAGGSIGSELCKQIILQNPLELILIDHSEYNLYRIKEDLEKINLLNNKQKLTIIKSILISINNYPGIDFVFLKNKPDIVFHAAAYKHVNLVETNIFESIRNNYLGTLNIVQVSQKHKVGRFLLISSDKAVRPSNVMGATKRLAEMAVQGMAEKVKNDNNATIYSIVRFGNVLASSGSVINKFSDQIKNKESLTVTDPDVTRYFMTIFEAVNLILQTYKMSKGGEVFLLNMGNPIKIIEIAKKMVRLSGLSIKDSQNPNGDIEIEIIGLRPGEKLYEELLIDDKSIPSSNKNIYYAKEKHLDYDELISMTLDLKKNVEAFDLAKTIKIMEKYVSGFKYSS